MLEVVVHNAPEKNAKRANNPHEFVQTTELVAPLPQNAPKWSSGAKFCTKTLLYQKLRYNSQTKILSTISRRDFFVLYYSFFIIQYSSFIKTAFRNQ